MLHRTKKFQDEEYQQVGLLIMPGCGIVANHHTT